MYAIRSYYVIDELIQASPRIILAIIIAIVISKPLELKIFQKEIDQVLLEQKNDLTLANKNQIAEQFNPVITALENDNKNLHTQIDTKEALYGHDNGLRGFSPKRTDHPHLR